jgi:hypothetical protein
MLEGLTDSGSITSVRATPRGTVSSIRASRVAHVERKRLGDSAKAFIVLLPSLEKMRASERVVTLYPTTSGFVVLPDTYSVALESSCQCRQEM